MSVYTLVEWLDEEDQPLNDATKYRLAKENVTEPSSDLSEGYEYFVMDFPYAMPDIDDRLVYLVSTKTMLEEKNDDGYRKWQTIYTTADRTDAEKEVSIEEEEIIQNATILTVTKQIKYLLLYTALDRRERKGYTITDEMQSILDKVDAKALKVWKNHTTALAKIENLEAGTEISIDEDWESGEDDE